MGETVIRARDAGAQGSRGGSWTTWNHRYRIIVVIARGTQRGQQFRWRGARLDHQLLGRLKLEQSGTTLVLLAKRSNPLVDGPLRLAGARRRMIRCGRLLIVGGTAGDLLFGLAVLIATVGFGCRICTTKKI